MNYDETAPSPIGSNSGSGTEPSLHQLRLFLLMTEELHFGHAAKRAFMTQPAFSKQIKQLEQRLGTRLAERGTRSVQLTTAGQQLLPAITSVIESMDRLQRLAAEHRRQVSGRLALGSIGAESAQPFAHVMLGELRRRHPEITVEIRSLSFSHQFRAVASGEVDAALLHQPVPPDLEAQDLTTGPCVAVLPADDPLAAEGVPPVALAQLADRTFIDIPADASREWWDYWSVNPRPDGTPVRYGPVVNDPEAIFAAVARGQGISFLPCVARHFFPRPGISYVDVTDLHPYTTSLVWAPWNRSRPVVAAIREAARAVTSC